MSQPGNSRAYLTGFIACDVGRLTGLPIYCRPHLMLKTYPTDAVDPGAAEAAIRRGAWRADDVMMDLTRMEYWDKMRVAWTLIGGYRYLDADVRRLAA